MPGRPPLMLGPLLCMGSAVDDDDDDDEEPAPEWYDERGGRNASL